MATDAANLQMSYAFEGNFNDGSGKGNNGQERPFTGLVDDVKIYNRSLSQAEVLGMAGRTAPVYKPFQPLMIITL